MDKRLLMIGKYHVRIFWSGRGDSPERLGYKTFLFLTALAGVHPDLAGCRAADARGRPRTGDAGSSESAWSCTEALLRATVLWKSGQEQRTSYTPRFVVERDGARVALLSMSVGIEPLDIGPVFAPNRLDLQVSAAALDPKTGPAALENMLRVAVAVFQPEWGHAGTESQPAEPISLFSDGAPGVGWMTYLSAAYPPLPTAFPSPSAAFPVASFGTLIVAHPGLFDPRDPAHSAAVNAIRDVLGEAEVLLPFAAVARKGVSA
ncbi:Imm52 family immunity protein [Sorangium sp. So ce117]|uniref:Imm52 family immunity protein n=1 Tax=Sorangium sp. So ce117 TaxID=3133277 RepID=UPI003F5E2297